MRDMLTAAEVEAMMRQYGPSINGTHSDTCWQWHYGCLIARLAASHLALLREYNKAITPHPMNARSAAEVMLDE